jgi:hypothetical protein
LRVGGIITAFLDSIFFVARLDYGFADATGLLPRSAVAQGKRPRLSEPECAMAQAAVVVLPHWRAVSARLPVKNPMQQSGLFRPPIDQLHASNL